MERPFWTEVLSLLACAAIMVVGGHYIMLNASATGQVVYWLLKFAFGGAP